MVVFRISLSHEFQTAVCFCLIILPEISAFSSSEGWPAGFFPWNWQTMKPVSEFQWRFGKGFGVLQTEDAVQTCAPKQLQVFVEVLPRKEFALPQTDILGFGDIGEVILLFGLCQNLGGPFLCEFLCLVRAKIPCDFIFDVFERDRLGSFDRFHLSDCKALWKFQHIAYVALGELEQLCLDLPGKGPESG